jgi:general secretion pathway protein D
MVPPSAGCGFDSPARTFPEFREAFMSIRLPFAHWTPVRLLLIGSLVLPLFAAPKLAAAEDNSAKPVRVTYQIADLVVPVPSGVVAAPVSGASTTVTREERLIKQITSMVEPRSWSDKGGSGTIDYHPLTMSLVINQTPAVQEQIRDMLKSLRRLQNQQVALEVRFLSVDETVAERLSEEFKGKGGITLVAASDTPLRLAFLNDAERSRLLEVVQGDRRANIVQTPKVTMFSGQSSTLEVSEQKSFVTGVDCSIASNGNQIFQPIVEEIPVGMRLTARPVISDDQRSVSLGLSVNVSKLDDPEFDLSAITLPPMPADENAEPAQPLTQLLQHPRISRFGLDGTFTIRDGSTALISGWKREHGVRTESGLPVLSDIPYLGRLFKSMGYTREKECVIMIVTPRIIVAEEQEEKAPTE